MFAHALSQTSDLICALKRTEDDTPVKKGITIGMGRDHDERYNTQLRDLIIAGRAKPSQIVSHRLLLSQAPNAFQKFDERIDGYIKVILDPQG